MEGLVRIIHRVRPVDPDAGGVRTASHTRSGPAKAPHFLKGLSGEFDVGFDGADERPDGVGMRNGQEYAVEILRLPLLYDRRIHGLLKGQEEQEIFLLISSIRAFLSTFSALVKGMSTMNSIRSGN